MNYLFLNQSLIGGEHSIKHNQAFKNTVLIDT